MLENRQAAKAARATGCSSRRKLPLTKGKGKGKALVKKTKSVEWFCLVCDENYADSRSNEQWIQCQMCLRWAHTENTTGDDTYLCHLCDPDSEYRPYSSGSCRCRSDDICHTSLVFNFLLWNGIPNECA